MTEGTKCNRHLRPNPIIEHFMGNEIGRIDAASACHASHRGIEDDVDYRRADHWLIAADHGQLTVIQRLLESGLCRKRERTWSANQAHRPLDGTLHIFFVPRIGVFATANLGPGAHDLLVTAMLGNVVAPAIADLDRENPWAELLQRIPLRTDVAAVLPTTVRIDRRYPPSTTLILSIRFACV